MAEHRVSHPPLAIALVIEDEPLFRLDLTAQLEERGYEVLEGSSARDALRYLEDGAKVALLVTDVRMPGDMDGIALAHEVARRWPATGIVLVSAAAPPGPDDLPGNAVFLGKPVTPAQLGEVASRWQREPYVP
ncbi:response regulator [Methylobacterium sp. WSM2598]|uniref:response regulator n=1 Tax=Methylobacterium sp. WSM2598 TaxID=398261 RepID=UPI00037540C3|nr:response regulator [Methylobacterium sp. WSM2598]